mmetsp:Transcript_26281/g.43599  ORF Transcript_26281/g.43599 Transcript_26281/m.43599 type:complete len:217 (+) Transcript_26281:36-686(+)|eukprot:CAMPEP_0119331906 /NCGR_PEP_ID=MMETSP1333-20130426/81649_1 /TAXON_ID=418940 /ORGANISM="Scyphosphaera apsteinii, Strain RCC1455" /LENGTH=216 /DNA_ID=CAMNT_0007341619 /DNA_START=14 /DNA_END=664 /DNA_ORIENTATION=-
MRYDMVSNVAEIGADDFINLHANALAVTAASKAFATRASARATRAKHMLTREQAKAREHTAVGVLEDLNNANEDAVDHVVSSFSAVRTASSYSAQEAAWRYPLLRASGSSISTVLALFSLFLSIAVCAAAFVMCCLDCRKRPNRQPRARRPRWRAFWIDGLRSNHLRTNCSLYDSDVEYCLLQSKEGMVDRIDEAVKCSKHVQSVSDSEVLHINHG